MSTGLLIIRLVVGLTLGAHGAQKLFGRFGGHGIAGTAGFFHAMGFRPGRVFATMAGLGEACGGLGVAMGLLTPVAAAAVIAVMLTAIASVHLKNGFFAEAGGYEYNLLIAAVAAGIACTGPGRFSLDYALGLSLAGWRWGLTALGLGVLGAAPALLVRAASTRRDKRSARAESERSTSGSSGAA